MRFTPPMVQDQATRKTLYRGRCVRGLYPLLPEFRRHNKQAYAVVKLSSTWWHDRLGYASFSLVEHLLRKNKLMFVGERHVETVCDSCQRAKIHQLAYPISTSVSTKQLQLIFSNVWGLAPTSPVLSSATEDPAGVRDVSSGSAASSEEATAAGSSVVGLGSSAQPCAATPPYTRLRAGVIQPFEQTWLTGL